MKELGKIRNLIKTWMASKYFRFLHFNRLILINFRLNMKDFDEIFDGKENKHPVTPFQYQMQPKSHFFGQSITSKTIRNSDGVVFVNYKGGLGKLIIILFFNASLNFMYLIKKF